MVGAGHDQLQMGARPSQLGDGFGDQSRLFVRAKGSEYQCGLTVRLRLVSRPVVPTQWDASDIASAVALDEEPAVAVQGDDDRARPEHEPGHKRRTEPYVAGA